MQDRGGGSYGCEVSFRDIPGTLDVYVYIGNNTGRERLHVIGYMASNGLAVLGSNGAEGGPDDSPEGYIRDQSFEMTISLTGNDWRNTFENLDAVDENGYEYIYEIVELTDENFTVSITTYDETWTLLFEAE